MKSNVCKKKKSVNGLDIEHITFNFPFIKKIVMQLFFTVFVLFLFLNYLQSILQSVSVWLSELHEACSEIFWCDGTFRFQKTVGRRISQRWSKNATVKMNTIHRAVNSVWLLGNWVKPAVTTHTHRHCTCIQMEQHW